MAWNYTPVTIRLTPLGGGTAQAVSGAHVMDLSQTEDPEPSFSLAICHIPPRHLNQYKISVAAPQTNSGGRIEWKQGRICQVAPVFAGDNSDNDPLWAYLHHALANGFHFFPAQTMAGARIEDVSLVKIRHSPFPASAGEHYLPLNPGPVSVPDPIVVRSCPFSLTTPAAFANFASTGTVGHVIRDSYVHGFLSDVRYLENMSGGVVMKNATSVGLVLGNLRKANGDGDFLVGVTWERLLLRGRGLGVGVSVGPDSGRQRPLTQRLSAQTAEHAPRELPKSSVSCVVALALSHGGHRSSWGLAVVLNLKTIVTNRHVIWPYMAQNQDGKVGLEILVGGTPVVVGPGDWCSAPYEALDVAFIRLSPEHQSRLAHISSPKIAMAASLGPVQPVVTCGFGLLLNETSLRPISARGHVLALVKLSGASALSKELPAMVVTSLPCWNGSLGGGLFTEDGRLVGIVCCNAQVWKPVLDGAESSATEKIPSFCLCLPMELVMSSLYAEESGETPHLNANIDKLWRLESYTQDVFEDRRETKL